MSFRSFLGSKSDWIKVVGVFVCIIAVLAFVESWGERRFVAEFAENFIAGWFIVFIPMIGVIGAVGAYIVLRENSSNFVVAAIVGVSVLFATFVVIEIGKLIPGVGWRVENFLGESY